MQVQKPKLYIGTTHLCIENNLVPLFKDYFHVIYNKHDQAESGDLVLINVLDSDLKEKVNNFKQRGCLPVIDNLWEMNRKHNIDCLTLDSVDWFWIHEHYYNKHFGYNKISLDWDANRTHLAFVPIRLKRDFRNQFVEKFKPFLDKSIWSYKERQLPNDPTQCKDFRYINSDWFQQTMFSIVVETAVAGDLFVTEKTWKAVALGHPFMIVAQNGILDYLKSRGFMTWSHWFDESYDSAVTYNDKLEILYRNCEQFSFNDYSKHDRLVSKHNKNLFYNTSVVEKILLENIIQPLINYAKT